MIDRVVEEAVHIGALFPEERQRQLKGDVGRDVVGDFVGRLDHGERKLSFSGHLRGVCVCVWRCCCVVVKEDEKMMW